MAVLGGSISSMSNAELGPVLPEAAPISEGVPCFSPVRLEDGGKGSTMDAPVRISPPSGVPSEAVAEIRFSQVARKRAAHSLSFFSRLSLAHLGL